MAQMRTVNVSEPPLLQFGPFKGLNLSVDPTQINQQQSPDMLNMKVGTNGSLVKRTEYERVFSTSLGEGAINGLFEYDSELLIAHGDKLYRLSDIE